MRTWYGDRNRGMSNHSYIVIVKNFTILTFSCDSKIWLDPSRRWKFITPKKYAFVSQRDKEGSKEDTGKYRTCKGDIINTCIKTVRIRTMEYSNTNIICPLEKKMRQKIKLLIVIIYCHHSD